MQKNKNIVKAINKNVRSSPRKINLLLKNIRGKKVDIAIRDLSFNFSTFLSKLGSTKGPFQIDLDINYLLFFLLKIIYLFVDLFFRVFNPFAD